MTARKIIATALASAALVMLGGCAQSFKADVARFQQLPAAQGESFTIVADDPALAGGLEFEQYASLVAHKLGGVGYKIAEDPAASDLIVKMRYDVDNGREKIRSTNFGPDPFYRGYGYGYWRHPYYWGFYDPFLFGPSYQDIQSYTVYTGTLELRIDRVSDGKRLFEGKAEAHSLSNKLTYLVPNLIDAIFVNFPGKSGETVKITLPPEKK
ncbi:MAG: DUF4136 domain-containing protein [Sphingomonadales bacterium]|nr:MAG: DUF4136 domain-containing protein [Sphingomonadales bacterium]TNF02472.1 MAG: DUF4136 domain-containing protein [Sphingomonadales bacterium]